MFRRDKNSTVYGAKKVAISEFHEQTGLIPKPQQQQPGVLNYFSDERHIVLPTFQDLRSVSYEVSLKLNSDAISEIQLGRR